MKTKASGGIRTFEICMGIFRTGSGVSLFSLSLLLTQCVRCNHWVAYASSVTNAPDATEDVGSTRLLVDHERCGQSFQRLPSIVALTICLFDLAYRNHKFLPVQCGTCHLSCILYFAAHQDSSTLIIPSHTNCSQDSNCVRIRSIRNVQFSSILYISSSFTFSIQSFANRQTRRALRQTRSKYIRLRINIKSVRGYLAGEFGWIV